ncbi:MAG: gamma-glutamylcyclotransferase [Proteobacteria bacterium]|nr:gamma-glutamylcyclotransferase [Pseudomonadota bacterium]
MALTPELVALCEREEADPGPDPAFTALEEADYDRLAERLHGELGQDPLWLFAYGSLIWKPEFEVVEQRHAVLHGWHRSFCLELKRWRGMPHRPGLILALDGGGRCKGVAYRLPDEDRLAQLRRLVYREVGSHEDTYTVRWVTPRTVHGPVRALAFWIGPKGARVARKLPLEHVAHVLARACGHGGSGAAYLYNTVAHLEQAGIRDRNLWRLQELVAAEIRAVAGQGGETAPGGGS